MQRSVHSARRRLDWSAVPSAFSSSAKRSVMQLPAGPVARSFTQPGIFWPKSKTKRPGTGSVTLAARNVRVGRSGGAVWAMSCVCGVSPMRTVGQPLSSKPGPSQPGCSSRAS
jgi:hypothetical protein